MNKQKREERSDNGRKGYRLLGIIGEDAEIIESIAQKGKYEQDGPGLEVAEQDGQVRRGGLMIGEEIAKQHQHTQAGKEKEVLIVPPEQQDDDGNRK